MSESKNRVNSSYLFIFGGVIALWCLCWWLVTYYIAADGDGSWANRGQFGDMFGAINALFSGLAFAGIIITILLQREELALQRKELSDTREVFEQQSSTMKRQRFENSFSSLLNLHNDSVARMIVQGKTKTYTGRDYLNFVIGRLKNEIGNRNLDVKNSQSMDWFQTGYLNIFDTYKVHLNPYLDSLSTLIAFVYQSELVTTDERDFYSQILTANIGEDEITLIYYHMALYTQDDMTHSRLLLAEKESLFFENEAVRLLNDSHKPIIDIAARRVKEIGQLN